MNIQFVKEPGCWIALAMNEVYNDMVIEELWFAEIIPAGSGVNLRWEDDWNNPILISNIEEAKKLVLANYYKHTPQLIGKRYSIDEV